MGGGGLWSAAGVRSRWRAPKPLEHDEAGPASAWAGQNLPGATSTAQGMREAAIPWPPEPPLPDGGRVTSGYRRRHSYHQSCQTCSCWLHPVPGHAAARAIR